MALCCASTSDICYLELHSSIEFWRKKTKAYAIYDQTYDKMLPAKFSSKTV